MRNLTTVATFASIVAGIALSMAPAQAAKPGKFYAAIVSANGAIQDSTDVDSVVKTNIGQYTVTFRKKIEGCYPVATIFDGTSGAIRLDNDLDQPKVIFVRTRSEGTATVNPDFADRSFSILVICQ